MPPLLRASPHWERKVRFSVGSGLAQERTSWKFSPSTAPWKAAFVVMKRESSLPSFLLGSSAGTTCLSLDLRSWKDCPET